MDKPDAHIIDPHLVAKMLLHANNLERSNRWEHRYRTQVITATEARLTRQYNAKHDINLDTLKLSIEKLKKAINEIEQEFFKHQQQNG